MESAVVASPGQRGRNQLYSVTPFWGMQGEAHTGSHLWMHPTPDFSFNSIFQDLFRVAPGRIQVSCPRSKGFPAPPWLGMGGSRDNRQAWGCQGQRLYSDHPWGKWRLLEGGRGACEMEKRAGMGRPAVIRQLR